MMDWNDHGEHMTTGGWIFMVLGMLVLVVLVVVLVMWIVSQQRKPSGGNLPPGMSARERLDHRLVSGEITTDQYDELRKKLDGVAPTATGPPGATRSGVGRLAHGAAMSRAVSEPVASDVRLCRPRRVYGTNRGAWRRDGRRSGW